MKKIKGSKIVNADPIYHPHHFRKADEAFSHTWLPPFFNTTEYEKEEIAKKLGIAVNPEQSNLTLEKYMEKVRLGQVEASQNQLDGTSFLRFKSVTEFGKPGSTTSQESKVRTEKVNAINYKHCIPNDTTSPKREAFKHDKHDKNDENDENDEQHKKENINLFYVMIYIDGNTDINDVAPLEELKNKYKEK